MSAARFKALSFGKLFAPALFSATLLLSSPSDAKTLIFCSEASPRGFDPALFNDLVTYDASSKAVYNRLVEFKRGTTEIKPGLAESWDISSDQKEYTFHLRKNVSFHHTDYFTPTRPLQAADVVFSFERQRRPDHPWHDYARGLSWEAFSNMGLESLIKDVTAVDEQTVRFTLTEPSALLLPNLALDLGSIVSLEYAEKLQGEGNRFQLNQKPIGTGPFQLVDYQPDAVIRYRANADYWDGTPKIDELIFAITTDQATRFQKLRAGECNVAATPAYAEIEALKADDRLTVMEAPGLNIAYLAFNTLMPPFDRADVRRAISSAINKDAIIEAVFQGQARKATAAFPFGMWGYNDTISDVYDPDMARKALDEAGVKDLKMKIWAMPVTRAYMPNGRRAAELIQADLQKAGVEAEIVSFEWGEYLARAKEPERDGAVIIGFVSDNGDPDNMLGYTFSCNVPGNLAHFCYQPLEEILQAGRKSLDQSERTELYKKAQEIIHEQAPWVPLSHANLITVMSKSVQGYVVDPFGSQAFDGVDILD